MSTACKDYLSSIISKNSVDDAAIPYQTEIHTFGGECAGRGAPKLF